MLTRVLFAAVLAVMPAASVFTLAGATQVQAETTAAPKVVALGLTTRKVTEDELKKGAGLPKPGWNTPAVAYAYVTGLKKGDVVKVAFDSERRADILIDTETAASDGAKALLMAGRLAVPAGGWDPLSYFANLTVTRGGKTIVEQKSAPVAFKAD
jgi:hypothetical protein